MKPFVRNMKRPTHVSHRGGSLVAPENTLRAFQEAQERYATDQLEMDVRMTRDGVLVVLHDATVDRTTDGSGDVAALSWSEVQRLDAGARFTPDGGKTFPFRGSGVTIPRFEDVLAATTLPIIVELKTPTADCRREVSDILRRMGARDRVCIGAVADEPAAEIRGEMPDVAVFYPDRAARAFVAAALRGAPPPKTEYDVLALPDREGSLNLVDSRIVAAAKQAGIPLQLWTINDEARMRECLALGVDGIQTDRPDLLRAAISDFRE